MGSPTTTQTARPAILGFARAARALAGEARRLGLSAPGFRSPPGRPETDRTIRRASWGAVVAVRLRGRPFEAVLADMVEGIVVANGLGRDAARSTRVLLFQAAHAAQGPGDPAAEAA